MSATDGTRKIEDDVVTDFSGKMSYGAYLGLDTLLDSQHPVSEPEHHDELLFIIQHQTSELWLKLFLHEIRAARAAIAADDIRVAFKRIARVKHIQATLTEQWSVLATLTPAEYAEFRGVLGNSSGFQSYQYRAVEFVLGNKNAGMLKVFESDPSAHRLLETLLGEPTLYDEFWRYLSRQGYDVPASALERDVSAPYVRNDELIPLVKAIYENVEQHWTAYEAFEELGRPRGELSAVAVPAPSDRAAGDRHEEGDRRFEWWCRLPATCAGVELLSRAVCRPNRDRYLTHLLDDTQLFVTHDESEPEGQESWTRSDRVASTKLDCEVASR